MPGGTEFVINVTVSTEPSSTTTTTVFARRTFVRKALCHQLEPDSAGDGSVTVVTTEPESKTEIAKRRYEEKMAGNTKAVSGPVMRRVSKAVFQGRIKAPGPRNIQAKIAQVQDTDSKRWEAVQDNVTVSLNDTTKCLATPLGAAQGSVCIVI